MRSASPRRSGHAPARFRRAFLEYVLLVYGEGRAPASMVVCDGETRSWRWLVRQLWRCTDPLPASACALLGLSAGATYAQAVQAVREERG
jgi:hypothetical protein